MAEQLRFDGQVAVITGAGRGVGRAHALALAARGARVVVNDLGGSVSGTQGGGDVSSAAAVVAEIQAAGGEAVANGADVSDPAQAPTIVADALTHFGRVDIVVTNAGNLAVDGMPGLELDQLRRHLDVHVIGSFNVIQAAWPHLAAQDYGRIVMTSSVSLFGAPFMIAYATAKGAVMSLGRSLAQAAAGSGIRVNLLAPVADTRMVTDPELRARVQLPELDADAAANPARRPELATPMLLVLAHRRCPVNGESLVAGLGRNARQFLAETPGILDRDIDAEELLARFGEVIDPAELQIHAGTPDAVAFREALIAERFGATS